MSRSRAAGRVALVAAVLAAFVTLSAQAPAPSVHITAPSEEDYVSGATRITAALDPPSAADMLRDLTVFADGKQVCVIQHPPFECAWEAGAQVAEHQIRVVARFADGRRSVDTVRTQGLEYAEAVDVDVVQVTAVVTDAAGRFVRDLPRSAFRVFDDGKAQRITSFASGEIPLDMVAAVDVSGSMTDALPHVKLAARRLFEGLREGDQVTLVGFNDNIFTLARRETNAAARVRALDRMRAWGGTALYDVLIKSVDLLGRQAGRRSIVLFSDGDDQSSLAPFDAAIRKTEGSDATIYAIGQGRAVQTRKFQDLLQRLATVSGGRAFFTEDPNRLDAVFGEILDDLRNQYVISYPTPDGARNDAWHTIRVEVDGGYRVRARQGYRIAGR